MARRQFTGEEVAKVLIENHYYPQNRTGSHLQLRYEHPDGEVRTVTVPMGGEIPTGTLRNIMEQAGGEEFEEFCAWIDRNR
jgi:Predicted periplasmic or secreted lipoprotein